MFVQAASKIFWLLIPWHHSMLMLLMSMVLKTRFICCSPHTNTFKKTSVIVDATTPFWSAPGLQQFGTKLLHMSSSKCPSASPLLRTFPTMNFVAYSVNFNFANSLATFKASSVNPDQCVSPRFPGSIVSVSRSPPIQDQRQFIKFRQTYIIKLNRSNRSKSFKRSKLSKFVGPIFLIGPNRSNSPNV